MKIILLRHGRVDHPPLGFLNAREFARWVDAYNEAGLHPDSLPTETAVQAARGVGQVVCSSLPRSRESAKALGVSPVLAHGVFNEAGLPVASRHFLRFIHLPVQVWAVLFRLMWLAGYSKNSESLAEAKHRGLSAVKQLEQVAQLHDSVLFVGHGVYNQILARALIKRGWRGPKSPGRRHWDFSEYHR